MQTIEVSPAEVTAAQARVGELRTEQAELTAAIDDAAANARAGNLAGVGDMPGLAADKSRVDRDLAAAEAELDRAQSAQERAQDAEMRKRFDQVVAQAREQRAAFGELFRQCCAVLGDYCANVEEATALANSLITALGMDPRQRNAIAELSRPLDPLTALTNGGGFRPSTGYGWDLRVFVAPLRPIGGNTK
jgi:hypothetical protein